MATVEQQEFLRSLEEEKSTSARSAAAQQGRFMRSGGGGLAVTVARAAGQSTPVNAGPINFTVTFNKPVTGFINTDVSFAGSSVGGTLAAAVTGGPSTYNVAVTGMSGIGNVVVSVPAGAATDAAGNLSPGSTSAYVMFGTALPLGVTLQAIDGERILGLSPSPSMSHDYYSSNGFTVATNAAFAQSWDDPAFFPIGVWYPNFQTQTDANDYLDLNCNVSHRITGANSSTQVGLLNTNHIWLLSGQDGSVGPGIQTVGLLIDEPPDTATIAAAFSGTSGTDQTARFWYVNFTWNQLNFGDFGGTPMPTFLTRTYPTPIGNRIINIVSADKYWFCGAPAAVKQHEGGLIYGLGRDMTADEHGRGSNCGDMIDIARSWQTGHFPAPILGFMENDDGLLSDAGKRSITATEINWGVWSSIVHGVRQISYFYGQIFTQGFDKTIQSGQTISRYDQAKATNGLIKNVARIINAPFALGYASVTPVGYVFPTMHLVMDNGIEIMSKYYNGGPFSNSAGSFTNGFYIFATVRGSPAQTNINATFTIKNTGATTATVINEARTIPITNGGTQFVDTFATAYVSHIYQIT